MANQQVSSRGNQLASDFGSLRSTFLEMDQDSIGLQGEMIDLTDESRRAIDAIQRKSRRDSLVHKSRMAQMRFDYTKEQMRDSLSDRLINQGFDLIGNVMTRNRDETQLEELKRSMGF